MKNKRIGIRDIATATGVSASTVSRALQGNLRISEPVRNQVIKIAESLKYLPQCGRERAVALVASRIGGHGYYGNLLESIQNAAYSRNYRLELILPDAVDLFLSKYYMGVLCVGLDAKQLKAVAESTCRPIVVFNHESDFAPNAYSVVSDDKEIMHRIFAKFISRGCRRIALLLSGDVVKNFSNIRRLDGYRQECLLRNIEPIEEIVQENIDAVEAAIMRIGQKGVDLMIYVASPFLINVERFLLQHDFPGLSLVSWENFILGKTSHPIVRQDLETMAKTGFALLENVATNRAVSRMTSVSYLFNMRFTPNVGKK
ncbi:MAG: LacI family transcriptional regulator [Victivallales bacterium]|jgi:DNA-binding LacI/PurR family transcriptional regulator|nr:LacI family transcriptional regulator [Victivallales bacterium]